MSWQDFIDKGLLEGGFVREAAILGHDPNDDDYVWAQSAGCNISKVEHAAIVEGLRDPPLREISIGGRKYRCTMSTLDMILGTARSVASDAPKGSGSGGGSGGAGCIIRTTNMAVIVAEHGPARSGHDEVLRGVDEFAGYLIRMGY